MAGNHAAGHTRLNPAMLAGSTEDEILRCFLHLVRAWRKSEQGSVRSLHHADVVVLVSILGTDPVEIERLLVAARSGNTTAALRRRRLLLASVAALSIGLGAVRSPAAQERRAITAR
jgi:hypothetical protein